MIKADQKKAPAKRLKQFRAELNSWITMVSVPQTLRAGKAITKTPSKPKDNTKKSDSNSTLSDPPSETVVKYTHQNWAPAKGDFAGWLRVPDCKLHGLMLWDPEENAKRQELQRRLFKRDIFFIIEILEGNIESKVRLLVRLAKIEKHYSSAYVMCQTLISVTNMEIPFADWDILFKFMINKHRNRIQHNL